MKLIIAEKPSVGRTLGAVLGVNNKNNGYLEGNGYIISWCIGHLVGLANPDVYDEKYAKWNMSDLPIIPEQWRLVISKSTVEQYKVLKSLMHDEKVDELICATDAGREGECIFRYVYNLASCKKPVKRLWTSSLEEKALLKALEDLKPINLYDNLFKAGFARAKADWIVGFNASRLFSIKYPNKGGLSIGRVQTPTLNMIVKRDEDIRNFVKTPFYIVEIDCGEFKAYSEKFEEKSQAEIISTLCNEKTATVIEVKNEIKKINPPKLYDLTTLQREANRIFGYTAQQTLDYAQSLYEKKLLTYPRTDSNYITDDMEQTVTELIPILLNNLSIASEIKMENPNISLCINNSKVSDHHALLPTSEIIKSDLTSLTEAEINLINLVSMRLLCAVSTTHSYNSLFANLVCEKNNFTAKGKEIIEDGWKVIEKNLINRIKSQTSNDEAEVFLPKLIEGQQFQNISTSIAEKSTHPPKPFTEDTLLSAMERAGNDEYDDDIEKKGIGTPATRASIIEGLVSREYIERKNKNLIATEKGITLINIVPENLKSAKTTADWETVLQNIEKGKSEISDEIFIKQISDQTKKLIDDYSKISENNPFQKEKTKIGICPKCGKNILEFPKSYTCESGKDCGFIIWKTISGKSIGSTQAKKLLSKQRSDLIKGFASKTGKKFDAYLIVKNDYSIAFEFTQK